MKQSNYVVVCARRTFSSRVQPGRIWDSISNRDAHSSRRRPWANCRRSLVSSRLCRWSSSPACASWSRQRAPRAWNSWRLRCTCVVWVVRAETPWTEAPIGDNRPRTSWANECLVSGSIRIRLCSELHKTPMKEIKI